MKRRSVPAAHLPTQHFPHGHLALAERSGAHRRKLPQRRPGPTDVYVGLRQYRDRNCQLIQLACDHTRKGAQRFCEGLGFEASHIGCKKFFSGWSRSYPTLQRLHHRRSRLIRVAVLPLGVQGSPILHLSCRPLCNSVERLLEACRVSSMLTSCFPD